MHSSSRSLPFFSVTPSSALRDMWSPVLRYRIELYRVPPLSSVVNVTNCWELGQGDWSLWLSGFQHWHTNKIMKSLSVSEFMYFVFTHMPGESYRRRLRFVVLVLRTSSGS